jgi:hypothetical protein
VSLKRLARGDSSARRSTMQLSRQLEATSSQLNLRISESLVEKDKGAEKILPAVKDREDEEGSEDEEEVRLMSEEETSTERGGASTATLPEGWTEVQDPESGHPYYYNHQRKKSMWERPQLDGAD